jgi:hypothetical protein
MEFQNLEVFARYIVEDAIHEALNIVRRDHPSSPTYGQLVVKDNPCLCVPSHGALVTSQNALMTSSDSAIMFPDTVMSKKESPKYGTLIILDDLNSKCFEFLALFIHWNLSCEYATLYGVY